MSPEALIELLLTTFPDAFYPTWQRQWPLKIGIHRDIVEQLPELSTHEVKRALAIYTGHPGYLEGMIEEASRFDLKGDTAGRVTEAEARRAAAQLSELRNPSTTRENHTMCGSKSVSQSSFVRDPAAADISPMLLSAEGLADVIRTHIQSGQFDRVAELIRHRDTLNVEHGRNQVSKALVPVEQVESVVARRDIHETTKKIVEAIVAGRKIDAIKEYRQFTGTSLVEAKNWVEAYANVMPARAVQPPTVKRDGFLLLSKPKGATTYGASTYNHRLDALEMAKRVTAGQVQEEVIVVEVLGRSKLTFEMLPAAA